MPNIRLHRVEAAVATFAGDMPEDLHEGWHLIGMRVSGRDAAGLSPGWMVALHLTSDRDDGPPQDVNLVRPRCARRFGIKLGVAFLRGGPGRVTARVYGAPAGLRALSLAISPLPRPLAAAAVWLQNPGAFRVAARAVSGPPRERLRKAIAAAATRGQDVPRPYSEWVELFDLWPAWQVEALRRALPGAPRVAALVLGTAGESLAATLASLEAQAYRPAQIAVAAVTGPEAALRTACDADWVALLQAGEVLPPHALLLLVIAASRNADASVLFADEDRLSSDGLRHDPLFKPQPSLTMMCSGLLSLGVWLVRPALLDGPADWAECLRLRAWFHLRREGQATAALRVPFVLTHRRPDTQRPPHGALSAEVNSHLRAAGIQAEASGDMPMRLRWHAGSLVQRKVSIVVPSRLKGPTQLSCLADVLAKTTHPNFEMLIVVTQDAPLDKDQRAAAERLCADGRVRVEVFRLGRFNYSAANNFAAGQTDGEFLLLLNDDVSTLHADWLDRMVAMMSDPQAGIIGAKLYYPNMTVQHGGAIMGLTGLVEHANRFLPRGEPGYAWRGVLDQEFSCVTGACMLVRRPVYEALGGLDEALPTGFNDVDFCLRARRLGWSVVFAAGVELVHHETISFGHHYAHDRDQELKDVRLMRSRWAEVCQADPFHNPNLSLAGDAEWKLAYPPRAEWAAEPDAST